MKAVRQPACPPYPETHDYVPPVRQFHALYTPPPPPGPSPCGSAVLNLPAKPPAVAATGRAAAYRHQRPSGAEFHRGGSAMTDATTATAPQRAARWVMVLGVVMIVAGVLAVSRLDPQRSPRALFFAVMFSALATRRQDGFRWKLVSGDRNGPPRRAVRRVPSGGASQRWGSSSAHCCSRTAWAA